MLWKFQRASAQILCGTQGFKLGTASIYGMSVQNKNGYFNTSFQGQKVLLDSASYSYPSLPPTKHTHTHTPKGNRSSIKIICYSDSSKVNWGEREKRTRDMTVFLIWPQVIIIHSYFKTLVNSHLNKLYIKFSCPLKYWNFKSNVHNELFFCIL